MRGPQGTAHTLSAAALLLVLLSIAAVGAQDKNTFKKTPPPIQQDFLPQIRPPLPQYRVLDDSTVSFKTYGSGAIQLTVVHKPFTNITAKMMQWMFQNLATGTAVSPVDGKTYPMFLLFHPRDHCAHNNSMTPLPAKSGSYNRFVEFPLTGCSETSSGTTWNFSCATRGQDNPGFTRNTSAEVWNASSLEKNNGNPRYTSLGSNKVEFSTRRCNDRGQCAYTVKTLQSWSYNKKTGALTVTSKLLIGLTWYAGSNTRIINTWADGLDPYHKFYRAAMHYTEEYSTLPGWLPDAYNKANPPKGR